MANPIVDAPRSAYGVPLPMYSARDAAITQRPPSTALLCIDSEDRHKDYAASRAATQASGLPNSPYDFTIQKNQSLMDGFFTRLGVSEIVFPWVIPNINDRTNKMFITLWDSSGSVPVFVRTEILELPRGFYTPAQLAAAIEPIVNAEFTELAGGFEINYGVDPFTPVVFGSTTANGNAFGYSTGSPDWRVTFDPMTPNTAAYPYGPQVKQLFDLLGFNNAQTAPLTAYDTSVGAGGYTLCQAIRYIDIVCTQLVNNQAVKDTMSQVIARDVLCRIYINSPTDQSTVQPTSATYTPPGCAPMVIYRNFATPKQIQWTPNQPVPGYLRFEVFDDNGENLSNADPAVLTHTNKTNWSLTLLVSEN